jgi:hypothetical protein
LEQILRNAFPRNTQRKLGKRAARLRVVELAVAVSVYNVKRLFKLGNRVNVQRA